MFDRLRFIAYSDQMQKAIVGNNDIEAAREAARMLDGEQIIRIDGHSHVGKSTFAAALAKELGWPIIATDDFKDGDRRGRDYLGWILRDQLVERLTECTNVVLEGICLDLLVPRDEFGPEFRIYVRACREPEFDSSEQRRRRVLKTGTYHKDFAPHLSAHLVVLKALIERR